MLGWKFGSGFRNYTKMQELGRYRALYMRVADSYGDGEAQRLSVLAVDSAAPVLVGAPFASQATPHSIVSPGAGALDGVGQLVPHEHPLLLEGGAALDIVAPPAEALEFVRNGGAAPAASAAQVAAPAASAAQPATPAASAVQAVVAGSSQASGFIVSRSAPTAPAPPLLASVQQLDEQVEVRGVCDGCGQNVMSNDEGRLREGSQYYHEQCVKGLCGGCGQIVHANADRDRISGVYWHHDCLG